MFVVHGRQRTPVLDQSFNLYKRYKRTSLNEELVQVTYKCRCDVKLKQTNKQTNTQTSYLVFIVRWLFIKSFKKYDKRDQQGKAKFNERNLLLHTTQQQEHAEQSFDDEHITALIACTGRHFTAATRNKQHFVRIKYDQDDGYHIFRSCKIIHVVLFYTYN
jgi:hypothetical protein